MAYSEAVLQRAQARLAQAKQQHDDETRSRIAAIYAQQPRLRQIDLSLRQTAARVMAVSFRRGEDPSAAMAELKRRISRSSRSETGSWNPTTLTPMILPKRRSARIAAGMATSEPSCVTASASFAVRSRKRALSAHRLRPREL